MRSITRLFSAFGTLADSLLALANIVDTATGRLRHQLAVEDAGHVLEHVPAVEGNADGETSTPTARRTKGKGA